jgi:hypothetical protein
MGDENGAEWPVAEDAGGPSVTAATVAEAIITRCPADRLRDSSR